MRFDAVTGDAKQLLERNLATRDSDELFAIWLEAKTDAGALRDFCAEYPDCADELAEALAIFRTVETFAWRKMKLAHQIERLRAHGSGPTPIERALVRRTPRAKSGQRCCPLSVRRRGSSRRHRPVARRSRRAARSPGRQASDDPSHDDVRHAPATGGVR